MRCRCVRMVDRGAAPAGRRSAVGSERRAVVNGGAERRLLGLNGPVSSGPG